MPGDNRRTIITSYVRYCIVCGTPATDMHHTIFGKHKKRCDEDRLLIPLCRACHEEVHHGKTPVANRMSRIIGQLAYEKAKCAEGLTPAEARDSFRKRYGESFL